MDYAIIMPLCHYYVDEIKKVNEIKKADKIEKDIKIE